MDESYLQFCKTNTQREALLAYIEHGSGIAAAKALGKDKRNVERVVQQVRMLAMLSGYSPSHDAMHPVMPTEGLKGRSILYKDGQPVLQWVKTDKALEAQQEAAKAIFSALKDDLPRYKPVTPLKKHLNSDLHNLYVITDYHMGMLSWGEETGEDWDLDIAERTLIDWFATAIDRSPDSDTATLCNLGDFLHWDGLEAVTPASKHVLDADTRFQKVVRTAIRTIRRVIGMLLKKHNHLTIIMADANHDPASGVWLREWLSAVYEDEPRVTVDNSADTYYCVRHGDTALFFHHGHKRKPTDVDSVLARKFRQVWGECKHHYAHLGHMHHDWVRETNLMKVEQHRTLAAKDAYASRGGWMAGRDAKVISYHKKHGEVGRLTISPEML